VSLTLHLSKREVTCRAGALFIHVQTERWVERKFGPVRLPGRWEYDPKLAYSIIELEIEVDEESGGDGEPAPRLEIEINPGHWKLQTIQALSGTNWKDGGGTSVVGWYGNDAPEIEGSVISFGAWCDHESIMLDWTGQYRWRRGDTPDAFRLSGPVNFAGLQMSVKDRGDATRFLAAALPNFRLDGLELQPIEATDFGPEMPDASRRHWELHRWVKAK
jgi:hypothetical protein